MINHGDYTDLAEYYKYRAGYSIPLLTSLAKEIGVISSSQDPVADIGAGTGKLSMDLAAIGLNVTAVEPNDAMRIEGIKECKGLNISWKQGAAESTGLEGDSYKWVLMGSSFHWTEPSLSVPEFYRIIKSGGYFTALWNPRDLERDELQNRIEAIINEIVPDLKRVSSGFTQSTESINNLLTINALFCDISYKEDTHQVLMSPERYIGAWRSVNDIQVQAGEKRWEKILEMINRELSGETEIRMVYRTRAWTVRVNK